MVLTSRTLSVSALTLLACGVGAAGPLSAQTSSYEPSGRPAIGDYASYVLGPSDVLAITSYDEPSLTGEFTVETDRTFSYPLIGRVRAGGMTLRQVEAELRSRLTDGGFYKSPQIMVSVEEYRSKKIFVLGEVQAPGTYTLSGDLRLVEVLALAGSTLPTAGGEAVIVPAGSGGMVADPSSPGGRSSSSTDTQPVTRVSLDDLQSGAFSENIVLRDGDAIFVPRAQSIYLMGQVRNPGAYVLQNSDTTVLQGLSLAGGVTDRGASSRVEIVRIVDGKPKKMKVDLTDTVLPGDTIVVPQTRF